MRVLLAFEESGTVTREFLRLGHDAWSCDLLPTSGDYPSRHFREDARQVMTDPWDLVIAFPPCTHLARSGARYWPEKQRDGRQQEAAALFMSATRANAPRIAIENPRGIMILQGLAITAGSCLAVALAFGLLYGSATIASQITGVPREQIIANP